MTLPAGDARRAGLLLALALAIACGAGCSGGLPAGKLYPIRGEVVSINASRSEVVLHHEAIAGFMQAMTMPFPVSSREILDGIAPGDRVEGVLVVEGARYALLSLAKLETTPGAPPPAGNG